MDNKPRFIICPYCGQTIPPVERCTRCGGYLEQLSRQATQIAMGPWFIRDEANPFLPGCSYELLIKQIQAQKITLDTVLRGPSTNQFWAPARFVPGVGHWLGVCHRCGVEVNPLDSSCPDCGTGFPSYFDRDQLGLLFPTAESAASAQRNLRSKQVAASGLQSAKAKMNLFPPSFGDQTESSSQASPASPPSPPSLSSSPPPAPSSQDVAAGKGSPLLSFAQTNGNAAAAPSPTSKAPPKTIELIDARPGAIIRRPPAPSAATPPATPTARPSWLPQKLRSWPWLVLAGVGLAAGVLLLARWLA
ncbi:MAG: hypothetical protein IT443_05655 [Phycisphaeraceae bacterium]|nr:hypothetical protein [Phycisphaeraceae bacterium]